MLVIMCYEMWTCIHTASTSDVTMYAREHYAVHVQYIPKATAFFKPIWDTGGF